MTVHEFESPETSPLSEPAPGEVQSLESSLLPQATSVGRWVRLLASNQVLAIADQAIVSLTSFFTNLTVARACGEELFGIYFLALSLLHFIKGLQEQLISSPYAIYVQRPMTEERLRRYTGSTAVHLICVLLAFMIVLGLYRELVKLRQGSPQLVATLGLLLWICPVFLLREYLRRLSFARFHFRTAFLTDVLMSLLHVGGVAYLAQQRDLTVQRAYLVLAAASGIGILFWGARGGIGFAVDRREIGADWRAHWQFGRFALFTFVIGCSTPFLMPWLVAGLLNEQAAGSFGICQTVVGVANMLIVGVGNFISPLTARVLAHQGVAALWSTLNRANAFFLVMLTLFFLFVAFCGSTLVSVLFGPNYRSLGVPMAIFALAQIPAALGVVAGNGLWAVDQPRRNLPADSLTLVSTVVLAVLLIPPFKVLGAVLAILIGQTLGACCRWWMLLELIGLPGRLRPRATGPEEVAKTS